jgi:HAE1 family hydrophobic/amphiphilic exporter-1
MSITELFIRRPVMTTLLMISLLGAGVYGYLKLPTSDLPPVDYPTIAVSASLPGASPQTVAATVAAPLERSFTDLPGLNTMTSQSSAGATNITLQFSLDRDINSAAQDVQAAISRTSLPGNMPTPPSYSKVNSSASPVFYLCLRSKTLPLYQVTQIAKDTLVQRISRIDGVAQVQIYGEEKYTLKVQVNPKRLADYQIDLSTVAAAIQRENSNLPSGSFSGEYSDYTIQTDGQLTRPEQYARIALFSGKGRVLRLGQVARISGGVGDDQSGSWWRGEPAITLAVQRQGGSNTVALVDAIRKLLPEMREELPPSITADVLYDASQPIRESIEDVQFTLLLAIALVVMVVFLFLRKLSATLITSLAVPISLIATFGAMEVLGYSLDILSLLALTLSVGFVVDDAIVMLENIVRHLQMGKRPLRAAIDGAREISFTLISTTLSLVVVFLPVVLMSGMIGRLLNEFAMVITIAILLSGLVSLSLTPMLSSLFLKSPKAAEGKREHDPAAEGGFIWRPVFKLYRWTLHLALRFRFITLLLGVALLAANIHYFKEIPKGFIPSEDRGFFMAYAIARQGISFKAMSRHAAAVAAQIGEHPAVKGVLTIVGQGPMNTAIMVSVLKPTGQRPGVDQVMAELRAKLMQYPGVMGVMSNPPPISVSVQSSRANYQYTLTGNNPQELYEGSARLLAKLRALPELTDVGTDLMIASPQVRLEIDREKASALGISAEAIELALYSAFSDRRISTIYGAGDETSVLLGLDPQYRQDTNALQWLYLRTASGKMTPLTSVARTSTGLGPVQVNHVGQFPAVTLSFNLRPGISLDQATQKVRETAAQILPSSVSGSFQGQAQVFQKSVFDLMILMLMALGVIYIILGILYESFIHPITILAGLPSATLGALLTLELFHLELNLYGFVGIILLIGIVKKNAIMMIDFALEAQRKHGKSPHDAITEGALVRFRPIMMTSVAAFMGILPIALGIGAGGASRQPLGMAVCGGLVVSQVVTLLITPALYSVMGAISKTHGPEPGDEA